MTPDEVRTILKDVKFPSYNFYVGETKDRIYLQAYYSEPDIITGELETQYTRKWNISSKAVKSEIVQTALKCVLTSHEHRVREHFTYKGERIFGPHFDVDALVEALKTQRKKMLDYRGKE